MNTKIFISLLFCLPFIIHGWTSNKPVFKEVTQSEQGATQISGIGFPGTVDECNDPVGEGATFIIKMTGDLEGCIYTFVEGFDCTPSGAYREWGREYFVGTYRGQWGTFSTDYNFEGKYEGCPENGEPLGAEIFGRCQHPIIEGTGTGFFEGVTGRLAFKDNVELLIFPYRGHLKF